MCSLMQLAGKIALDEVIISDNTQWVMEMLKTGYESDSLSEFAVLGFDKSMDAYETRVSFDSWFIDENTGVYGGC